MSKESSKNYRIGYVYLTKSTFVERDLKILDLRYEVIEFPFFSRSSSSMLIPFLWIKQVFRILFHIRKIDAFFCWFIDYHALVPAFFSKIFNKHLICVLGGFDTINIPQINHGLFNSRWRAPIGRYVYQCSILLLPVSSSLMNSENSYTHYPINKKFGFKHEVNFREQPLIIPVATGYDKEFWMDENKSRKSIISTVAFVNSDKRVWIKGIDILLKVAHIMPNYKFIIAGFKPEYILHFKSKYHIPDNVKLELAMSALRLKKLFNKTKVYVQLSRLEGFPNVLCEAILCGCVPVGSNIFGIPEIITNEELLVNTQSPDIIKSIIQEAMESCGSENIVKLKKYVQRNFGMEKRENILIKEINNLLRKK